APTVAWADSATGLRIVVDDRQHRRQMRFNAFSNQHHTIRRVSRSLNRDRTPRSIPNFARQNFPPKTPVSHKAKPRILERRWFVVLEAEVADPRERIALDKRYGRQPPQLRGAASDEQSGP